MIAKFAENGEGLAQDLLPIAGKPAVTIHVTVEIDPAEIDGDRHEQVLDLPVLAAGRDGHIAGFGEIRREFEKFMPAGGRFTADRPIGRRIVQGIVLHVHADGNGESPAILLHHLEKLVEDQLRERLAAPCLRHRPGFVDLVQGHQVGAADPLGQCRWQVELEASRDHDLGIEIAFEGDLLPDPSASFDLLAEHRQRMRLAGRDPPMHQFDHGTSASLWRSRCGECWPGRQSGNDKAGEKE